MKKKQKSPVSKAACCNIERNGDLVKLHGMCQNLKWNRQIKVTFTPIQFQLEGNCFIEKLQKIFETDQTA